MFFFLKRNQPFHHTRLFTYFIPAPPSRKTGYRERQFDSIINKILENGFEITEIRTEVLSNASTSGMWVLCKLRPLNSFAQQLSFDEIQEQHEGKEKSFQNDQIEGLYHIES